MDETTAAETTAAEMATVRIQAAIAVVTRVGIGVVLTGAGSEVGRNTVAAGGATPSHRRTTGGGSCIQIEVPEREVAEQR